MKGILKIYHPEETLKYYLKRTYCKAVYSNAENVLEVEIITDDSLDHVDDDSLQYRFPQLSFKVSDFLLENGNLSGQTLKIEDTEDDFYTEVDLFDDEEAFLYESELSFSEDETGELQLFWQGKIDDFFTGGEDPIPFKLKCNFREEVIEIDD